MPHTAFSRTFAALLADRGRVESSVIAGALLTLVAAGAWAVVTPLTMYEVSAAARVELDSSVNPVQSPVAGRVVGVDLRVGQAVHKGDVLVDVDAVPEELSLRQEQVQAASLVPEAAKLRSQIAAEEEARVEERGAARLQADEAASRVREAETDAEYTNRERARIEKLYAHGLVSERDWQKTATDAARIRATLSALEAAARRVGQDQATRERERDVRIERLYAQIAAVETERRTLGAGADRLGYEIERRRVRAPIDGTVAEAALLRVGAVIHEGDRLASVVPSGHLLVAAEFPADRALGRIRPGQAATLRLDGFPWTEFGSVAATVSHVAQEIRDGTIRVESTIDSRSGFRGTLQHGMPGSLEITVEHVTPLGLALRAAGQAFTTRR